MLNQHDITAVRLTYILLCIFIFNSWCIVAFLVMKCLVLHVFMVLQLSLFTVGVMPITLLDTIGSVVFHDSIAF